MKILFGTLLLLAASAIGLLLIGDLDRKDTSETSTIANKSAQEREDSLNDADKSVLDSTLIIGSPDAAVTIVEYFDYKCPNCHTFDRTIKEELKASYLEKNQIKFELRTTPIIGPDSARAARGAYCAAEQDAFSSYHDAVMDYMWTNYYQDSNFAAEFEDILTNDVLSEIVTPLSIDSNELISCIETLRYNPALDRDLLAAAEDGVRGTPGFVIGEQSFVGVQPLSVFTALIESQQQ